MITVSTHFAFRIVATAGIAALTTGLAHPVAQAQVDLNTLRSVLVAYRELTGAFPTTAQGLSALVTRPVTDPKPKTWRKLLEREILDPWGSKYVYKHPGERNQEGYDLFSIGEDGKARTPDDVWPK